MISAIPRLYTDLLTVEGICTEQNDSLSSCMKKSKQVTKLLYSIQVERHEKPTSEYYFSRVAQNINFHLQNHR